MYVDIKLPTMKPSTADEDSAKRSNDDFGIGWVKMSVVAAIVS